MQEKFLLDRIRVDCSNPAPHTRYSVQFSVSNLRNEVERWNSLIIFGDKTYARPVHKI